MPTKTEEYLRILAEGGDAPTGCCMTNTQKLIAEAIERINSLDSGGQYALILYSTLSDMEEILPLSSDIDGGDTSAKLIGVSVDDFLQYLEDVTAGERADLPNLKIHVFDAGSGMDAITVGDASIAYRYTGEDDPETGDPVFHYYISFAAYSSTDEIYKYYQGEVKLDNDEWCIGLKEVPFGYPDIDNEGF